MPDRPATAHHDVATPTAAWPDSPDGTPVDAPVDWFGVDHEPRRAGAPSRTPTRRRRRRRVAIGAALGTAAAAIAVVAIVPGVDDGATPARPDIDGLAAAGDVRLPDTTPSERWSTTLRGTGSAKSTDLLVDGTTVVAIVDDGSPNRGSIVALDALDGSVRWRRGLAYAPEELRLLGVADGTLVIQQAELGGGRRALAFDLGDGATAWEDRVARGRYEILLGTSVVTRLSASESGAIDRPIDFLAPRTGERLGGLAGSIAATDLDGRWAFWRDDRLVVADLAETRPGRDPSTGIALVDVAAAGFSRGDAVLVEGGAVAVGPAGTLRLLRAGAEPLALESPGGPVDSLLPAGGDRFVMVAGGAVVGAEVVDDMLRVVWRSTGTVESVHPTAVGLVVVVAVGDDPLTDSYRVLDAVTGDELAEVDVPRGDPIDPVVTAEVVAVRRASPAGDVLVATAVDGAARWSLAVGGRVAVGDGRVVVLDHAPDGFTLHSYD